MMLLSKIANIIIAAINSSLKYVQHMYVHTYIPSCATCPSVKRNTICIGCISYVKPFHYAYHVCMYVQCMYVHCICIECVHMNDKMNTSEGVVWIGG